MTGDPEVWTFSFVAQPGGDSDAAQRCRLLLKLALRICRLRCVKVWGPQQKPSHAGKEPAEV